MMRKDLKTKSEMEKSLEERLQVIAKSLEIK
jgi:hypothetical protein